jgi:hypothetical protein
MFSSMPDSTRFSRYPGNRHSFSPFFRNKTNLGEPTMGGTNFSGSRLYFL